MPSAEKYLERDDWPLAELLALLSGAVLAPAEEASDASVRAVLLPPADLGRELGGGLIWRGLPPCGLALALRVQPAAPGLREPPDLALGRGVGFEEGDFECRGLLDGPGRRMEPASEMRGTGGSQSPLLGSFSVDLPFAVVRSPVGPCV